MKKMTEYAPHIAMIRRCAGGVLHPSIIMLNSIAKLSEDPMPVHFGRD